MLAKFRHPDWANNIESFIFATKEVVTIPKKEYEWITRPSTSYLVTTTLDAITATSDQSWLLDLGATSYITSTWSHFFSLSLSQSKFLSLWKGCIVINLNCLEEIEGYCNKFMGEWQSREMIL